MAVNLRVKLEADLSTTLEGAFGLPVVLIDPDGNTIDTSENDGEPLMGQVLFDTVVEDPTTGERIVVNDPIVSLRRSSLPRVPLPGEKWSVKIPIEPVLTGRPTVFLIDATKSPEGGWSIGFIRLYLKRAANE